MDDVIKVEEQYYILATSSRADERALVLKQGETFGVFDHYGDILPFGLGEQGLYHRGTRHLSHLEMRLGRRRPLLLSSTVREDNDLLTVDLTNPDMVRDQTVQVARATLHIFRAKFLWADACYERVHVANHGLDPVSFAIEVEFGADFADIFEVRGMRRERRGRLRPPHVTGLSVELSYHGLDDVVRATRVAFSTPPATLTDSLARFELTLDPQSTFAFTLTVSCGEPADPRGYDQAFARTAEMLTSAKGQRADVVTSNEQFNDWINRSNADLHMMVTETALGPYPYAGVPWFSTPFGRDGLMTAFELLWIQPGIARGVLAFLAATQAAGTNPDRDAEPGKILHETRGGEMAALGEVPFDRYYGSVDATPLFVMLAGAYYDRTGDRAFIEHLWPHVERALAWIDHFGDRDGDGFVEYARQGDTGLIQQGWKDSADAMFHADGRLAEAPIALCEVQGYVYDAKLRAASLASMLGHKMRAYDLAAQAEALRERFEAAFWLDELGTYAMALDGQKQPCRVRSSNAGHCLFTGIASPARARRVAEQLFDDALCSGWGVRTVASSESRYNPMSYHNGSVWPHDNAIIAAGLARYGFTDLAGRLLGQLFDVSLFVDLRRMPELFCGFARRAGGGPTRYPVACVPQAWAAGAVFLMIEACLGLSIDAPAKRVTFSHALLPPFLKEIRIENLRVGASSLDLLIVRHTYDVGVRALRRATDVEIVLIK